MGNIDLDGKKLVERLLEVTEKKTQAAFADAYDVKTSSISGWKSGAALPKLALLLEIAREKHVSVDYLLGLTDTPSSETKSANVPSLIDLLRYIFYYDALQGGYISIDTRISTPDGETPFFPHVWFFTHDEPENDRYISPLRALFIEYRHACQGFGCFEKDMVKFAIDHLLEKYEDRVLQEEEKVKQDWAFLKESPFDNT